MRIIVALLLAATVTAAERTEAPDSWHVEGEPQVLKALQAIVVVR